MIGFLVQKNKVETVIIKLVGAIFFFFILFLLIAPICRAADIDAYQHWVPSNTMKTVEWVATEGADGYEIYLVRVEDGKRALSGKLMLTNFHSIKFITPGHWVYYVRSYKTVNGVKQFGEWGNSLDPEVGIVNGHPRSWVVYVPFIK